MDNFIPYLVKSGDWVLSFLFLYAVIKFYVMKKIEELGNKISKIEKKIEEFHDRKIDRIDYYSDYSEFKAEFSELRKDIKSIYFMLGGSKCSDMKF